MKGHPVHKIAQSLSHVVTGVVVGAFAAHEQRRASSVTMKAGKLLAPRFFRRDVYPERSAAVFWTKFSHPFWFADLLSSRDSLSRLGFDRQDTEIKQGLAWFVAKQRLSGAWEVKTEEELIRHSYFGLASRFAVS
jgi:hypothetical protein